MVNSKQKSEVVPIRAQLAGKTISIEYYTDVNHIVVARYRDRGRSRGELVQSTGPLCNSLLG